MEFEKKLIFRYVENRETFDAQAWVKVKAKQKVSISGEEFTESYTAGEPLYIGSDDPVDVFERVERCAESGLMEHIEDLMDLVEKAKKGGYEIKVEVQKEDC